MQLQYLFQVLQCIDLIGLFIFSPAGNTWETKCNAGLMSAAGCNALKSYFKYQFRANGSYRSELFQRIPFYECIYLRQLLIRQPRISFCKGHQLVAVLYGKRIIRIEIASASMTLLGIYHYSV